MTADITLGIDPGLNRTGYAVIERVGTRPRLREGGVLRSSRSDPLAKRLIELGTGIRELLTEFAPRTLAVEQVFSHASYPKTAILMAHARGTFLYQAALAGIAVVHYTPTQIKRLLTGSGKASKEQIQLAIQRELNLPEVLEPNDVADAAAVALCHVYSSRLIA